MVQAVSCRLVIAEDRGLASPCETRAEQSGIGTVSSPNTSV